MRRVSIFKRAECSLSLLRVDKKFLLRNRILPSGKLCFLDNDLSNTSGHAISSEQRNKEYMLTLANFCSLWLISVATALVFGFSRHKVAHSAEKENDPDHALIKNVFYRGSESRR